MEGGYPLPPPPSGRSCFFFFRGGVCCTVPWEKDEYRDDSGNYTQTVFAERPSRLHRFHQRRLGAGLRQRAWIDVSIFMDSADPNYKQTQAKGEGVTGELTTSDGGKTWTVGEIGIPEHCF
ncbi:hypothetical protein D0864_15872 [Hortaea werneckii]|uniref:Photosynthesis system II assembly factor Ycf48/Hcf136-like domain-containing protein n=1 Tax=Hortaea werneckii TaxID=91943 RepID=A0A3M7BU08_HORWE|nr:hypothetical protein D0864_15872 [Hortaea werneckii]